MQRISGESLINNGNSKTVLVTGPLGQLNLPFNSIEIPTVGISWAFDLMRDSVDFQDNKKVLLTSLENFHTIVVDNDSSARILISLGFPEINILNFPWGVPTEYKSPTDLTNASLRSQLGEGKIVFSPRSLHKHYNQPLIFRAFGQVREKFRDAKLVLIDDDPSQRRELMSLANELKIEASLVWLPFSNSSQLEFWLQ